MKRKYIKSFLTFLFKWLKHHHRPADIRCNFSLLSKHLIFYKVNRLSLLIPILSLVAKLPLSLVYLISVMYKYNVLFLSWDTTFYTFIALACRYILSIIFPLFFSFSRTLSLSLSLSLSLAICLRICLFI